MIQIPDEGKIELLTLTLREPLVTDFDFSLRLYRNSVTPSPAVTLSTFTEATFMGYFRYDLARADWGVPVIVSGRAKSLYDGPSVEWTAGDGPQTIYGYYVVNPLTAKVCWWEPFNTPRTLNAGDPLVILPVLTGRGEV